MTEYDFSLLTSPPSHESNTQLWLDARRGRITASKRAHQILYSRESTISLMMDQMAEELLHPAEEGFSNVHTRHGHAFEEQAINEYAMERLGLDPIDKSPGMFVHPDFDIASATPDFFEGDDITGQIKCPSKISNHNSLLHFGVKMVSSNYWTQIQFEAFVTGRSKIVFVSYHPDAPATNQLHYEDIAVDEKMHELFHKRLTDINHMLVNNVRPAVKKAMPGVEGIPDLFPATP